MKIFDLKYSASLACVTSAAGLLLCSACLLMGTACTKVETERTDIVGQGDEMLFRVSSVEDGADTKALIGQDAFKTAGNTIRVFDAWSTDGFTTSEAWIPGQYAVCNTDGATIWPFSEASGSVTGDVHYYWSKTGKHRFYSVLDRDAASSATTPSGWGFDSDNKIYSVPQSGTFETSPASEQFDMLYSNVIERDIDAGASKSAVALKFSHLFSAYGFTFHNDSPNDYVIRNVVLKAKNVGKATIDYTYAWASAGTEAATVNYYESEQSMTPSTGIQGIAGSNGSASTGSEYTVASGVRTNLFLSGKTYAADDTFPDTDYTLVWPQDLTGAAVEMTVDSTWTETNTYDKYEFKAYRTYNNSGWNPGWSYPNGYVVTFTESSNGDYDKKTGSYSYTAGRRQYTVDYDYYVWAGKGKGSYVVSGTPSYGSGAVVYNKTSETVTETKSRAVNKTVSLPSVTDGGRWDAGKKYLYDLVYSNNELSVNVSVMYWNGGHGGDVTFE